MLYKACLPTTGAIQAISNKCNYKELGLESLSDRRRVRKLILFYKKWKGTPHNSVCKTRSASQISLNAFRTRTEKFKNWFFLFSISEWNELSNLSKQSEYIKKFKNTLMKYIKSNERSLLSIHNPQGLNLVFWLRLNFSHLNEHKFRHNFKECVSPKCGCGLKLESTQHFFLRCHFCHVERSELLNSLYEIQL